MKDTVLWSFVILLSLLLLYIITVNVANTVSSGTLTFVTVQTLLLQHYHQYYIFQCSEATEANRLMHVMCAGSP